MNSCVLMGKIVRNPQLRYTQDSQLAVTEMMVEFDNLSPNNPPCNLKVIAWGNLATEIEQKYVEGNQVILTGRLKIETVERQGYKEKVTELTISHIYPVTGGNGNGGGGQKVVNMTDYQSNDHSSDTAFDDDEPPLDGNTLDQIPF